MSSEKKKQGFASLTPEKHKEISSKGGKHRGPKGASVLSPEQRKINASIAAKARWAKVKAEREATDNDVGN